MKCLGIVFGILLGAAVCQAEEQPLPGVFIQPFPVCRQIQGANGPEELCVNASIAASTKEGRKFAEDSSCSTVRTQRPYRPLPNSQQGQPDDPRLNDPVFMKELNWVKSQIQSSACTCCHDTSVSPDYAAWDVSSPYVWMEQMSDRALAIMAGDVSTSLMGVYPKEENFGFDRSQTGAATTDVPRMKAFFQTELARRGVTAEDISGMPSGNGPFEQILMQKPVPCTDGMGIDQDGRLNWGKALARYVYITEADGPNPLSPPNSDLPRGTIWRLDVWPSRPALSSGIPYGEIQEGTRQIFPKAGVPALLEQGKTYRLYTTRDVLRPIVNCTFIAP